MFCTSDIVNGAELFAERQYFFKSCVNRIRNIFHAVVLCSFLFDKAQNKTWFLSLCKKHIANGLFLCFFILLYVFHRDNRFFSDKIKYNEVLPNVFFTHFLLFNKEVEVGEVYGDKVILDKALNFVDQVELDYKQNMFCVQFEGKEN